MMDRESDGHPQCPDHQDEALTQSGEVPGGHTSRSQSANDGQLACFKCHASQGIQLRASGPSPGGPGGISRKLWSLMQEEKISINRLIARCEETLCQLGEYRGQLGDWKTHHLQLQDRLNGLVEQNMSAMRLLDQEDASVAEMTTRGQEEKTHLHATLGSLDTPTTENEAITATNRTKQCKMKVEDCIQRSREIFPDATTVQFSVKVQETIRMALEMMTTEAGVITAVPVHLGDSDSTIMEKVGKITGGISLKQLTVEDLRRMRAPVRRLVETGLVLAVQEDQDGRRSARITLQDGQLCLHPLLPQPPPTHAHTLKYEDVVVLLDARPFTLAFLDLRWSGSPGGRVTIRLPHHTGLATQFSLLCTGQLGPNYIGTQLLEVVGRGASGECVRSASYSGDVGAPLVPDLWQGQYGVSGTAGAVVSGWWRPWPPLGNHHTGQIIIITRDLPPGVGWGGVFGEVVTGLEVVRAAVNHTDVTEVTVVDCGVLLPL
ncbi:uncharacterized protein [Procambarus clarkii]|uniref:uncharacterized protein isoform X1 n=1 Tax=Procambarus clarkii TaxID=6728 RepID=UPI0037427F9E